MCVCVRMCVYVCVRVCVCVGALGNEGAILRPFLLLPSALPVTLLVLSDPVYNVASGVCPVPSKPERWKRNKTKDCDLASGVRPVSGNPMFYV